jgi:hypothetical protein
MAPAAQLDSETLRAKFGPPLNRETFRTPQGFELIVDFGPNHEVCRLEMPGEPEPEMRRFLDDLVPESMMGKEVTHGHWSIGGISISHVIYEHAIVKETTVAGRSRTLSVEFRKEGRKP